MSLWSPREQRSDLLLACLRIMMGAIFVAVWSFNLRKGFYSPHGWAHFVQHYADTTVSGPLRHVPEQRDDPQRRDHVAGTVRTRAHRRPLPRSWGSSRRSSGSSVPLFQLNLLVATSGTTDWPGTYIIMCLLLLAIALSQSGRTLGLDARLARRRPHPRLPVY